MEHTPMLGSTELQDKVVVNIDAANLPVTQATVENSSGKNELETSVSLMSNVSSMENTALQSEIKKKRRRRSSSVLKTEAIGENEQVFVVRSTNEFYREYDAYLKRICELRAHIHECPVTGKRGLTYYESLASAKAANEILQAFPEALVPKLLKSVQHSTNRLTDIVKDLHLQFKGNVTMALLKLKVKESTWRASSIGAPWVVKSSLAKKYNISEQMPKKLQDIVDAYKSGKKRKHKSNSGASTPNNKQAKSSQSTCSPSQLQDNIKYPIEDTQLSEYTLESPPPFEFAPEWSLDTNLVIFGDVFMSFHFLNRFSSLLRLSPFTLDLWLDSLNTSYENPLMKEVLLCLMELLRMDSEYGGALGNKPLSNLEADDVLALVEALEDEVELYGLRIDGIETLEPNLSTKRQIYAMEPQHKARLVRIFCDMALRGEGIRAHIDDEVARLAEIRVANRTQRIEDNKELREQRKVIADERLKHQGSTSIQCNGNDDGGSKNESLETTHKADVKNMKTNKNKSKKKNKGKKKKKTLFQASRTSATTEAPETPIKIPRQQVMAELKRERFRQNQERQREINNARIKSRVRLLASKVRQEEDRRELEREIKYQKSIASLSIRVKALGADRYRRHYYWAPGGDGRLIVTDQTNGKWGWYTQVNQVQELRAMLNDKGVRECKLLGALFGTEPLITSEMAATSKALLHHLRDQNKPKRLTRSRVCDNNIDDAVYINEYRFEEL